MRYFPSLFVSSSVELLDIGTDSDKVGAGVEVVLCLVQIKGIDTHRFTSITESLDGFLLRPQRLAGSSATCFLVVRHDEHYSAAANLIAFDKGWSTLIAPQLEDPEAEEFTAGFLTEYQDNLITAGMEHQALASGFPVGRRFKSDIALRRCDAVTTHIGHEHSADGHWRIYVFAGQATPQDSESALNKWAQWMEESEDSPLNRFTPEAGDRNAVFDIKATYQQHYHSFDLFDAPEVFFPRVGPYKLQNLENVWTALDSQDIFESRGISRDGAIVVVRPDQYVAAVLPLEDTAALAEFFNGNLLEP